MGTKEKFNTHAPFTEEEKRLIQRWQECGLVHELTCAWCSAVLIPMDEYLACPSCDFTQNWVPNVVLNADLDKVVATYKELVKK